MKGVYVVIVCNARGSWRLAQVEYPANGGLAADRPAEGFETK